jgi:hypothetical protein
VIHQSQDCERSSAAIELQDLHRLSEIARSDLQRYIAGDPGQRAALSHRRCRFTPGDFGTSRWAARD